MVAAITPCGVCDGCSSELKQRLDDDQELAVEHLFGFFRDGADSEDPQGRWPLIRLAWDALYQVTYRPIPDTFVFENVDRSDYPHIALEAHLGRLWRDCASWMQVQRSSIERQLSAVS